MVFKSLTKIFLRIRKIYTHYLTPNPSQTLDNVCCLGLELSLEFSIKWRKMVVQVTDEAFCTPKK